MDLFTDDLKNLPPDLDYTHVQDTFEGGKAELLDSLYLEYCRQTRRLMHSYSRPGEE
jgi:hypothetical protein